MNKTQKAKEKSWNKLEARREMLEASGLALRVPASVPGMSMGASAGPHALKKKRNNKPKSHPGLPSQERQALHDVG